MRFELFADVILTRGVANRGLRAGDVGTVVERHTAPGMTEEGYSVEFFDMTGNTVAVVTVPASVLRDRSFIDLQGDSVLECAIADLLDEGLLQRHVRKVVRIYRARLHALTTALNRQLGGFVTFRPPSGGTAIWVTTRDARTMSAWNAAAARLGVIFDAGGAFTLDGQNARAARPGFACLTEEEIATASRRLTAAASRGAPRRAEQDTPRSPRRS